MKLLSATFSLLIFACSAPDMEKPRPSDPKIDSSISLSQIESITEKITVSDFLKVLGLTEENDDWEKVLESVDYLDTESSENHYELKGGGAVKFTTDINLSDREMKDAVYSKNVLDDFVTGFSYSCDGRDYSFSLIEGHYVERRFRTRNYSK